MGLNASIIVYPVIEEPRHGRLTRICRPRSQGRASSPGHQVSTS